MFAKHPRGRIPLFFTEMWERFSFYCMLALMMLFMTAPESEGGLGFDTKLATQIYGLYIGFIYFTPFGGGIIADKFWGYSKTIIAGGLFMMGGHLALAGEWLHSSFFLLLTVTSLVAAGLLVAFLPRLEAAMTSLQPPRWPQEGAWDGAGVGFSPGRNGPADTAIKEPPPQGIQRTRP
ncbi:MAG: hypothetical protein L0Z62_44800 [Gemmataceae bacterium]|nr:hypothetical protein [Gemmataceae bacterium]